MGPIKKLLYWFCFSQNYWKKPRYSSGQLPYQSISYLRISWIQSRSISNSRQFEVSVTSCVLPTFRHTTPLNDITLYQPYKSCSNSLTVLHVCSESRT